MKIVIAFDLHLDVCAARGVPPVQRLAPLVAEKPDWLVIGGDLCQWDFWNATLNNAVLPAFRSVKVAIIPGNHDFWTDTGQTVSEITELQYVRCTAAGVIYLPRENVELEGVTLVGSSLWYDYSFAPPAKYTKEQLERGYCRATGRYWMDMQKISRTVPDTQLARTFLKQFKQRISEAKGSVISVTHMLPFVQLNGWPESLFSAYSGNTEAGKLLDGLGDRLHSGWCGHTHRPAKHGRHTNVGNDYDGKLLYGVVEL